MLGATTISEKGLLSPTSAGTRFKVQVQNIFEQSAS